MPDSDLGHELWRSDGSEAGTTLVKDIVPGAESSLERHMGSGVVNGAAVFGAWTPEEGYELWRSDGSEAGTRLLKDVTPGRDYTISSEFAVLEGDLVFFAGGDLWTSAGSEETTEVLLELDLSEDQETFVFCSTGELLFFWFEGELWRTDGSAGGTVALSDTPHNTWHARSRAQVLDGQLFWTVIDNLSVPTLWHSDGTPAGTAAVITLDREYYQHTSPPLVAAGNELYFAGSDDEHGIELWASDGTAAGTRMLADISPETYPTSYPDSTAPYSSHPQEITVVGTTLFFSADRPEYGRELWAMPLEADPRGTTTIVESSEPLSPFGRTVRLSIMVTAVAGTPTGTVTLRDGDSELAVLSLTASGGSSARAVSTTASLGVGDHILTAEYSGDAELNASLSLPVIQTILPAATLTTLTPSASPVWENDPVTLTARVDTRLQVAATGQVSFSDAVAGPLGSADLDSTGQARLQLSSQAPGTYFISAAYAGEQRFQPSASGILRLPVGGDDVCPSYTSLGEYQEFGYLQNLDYQIAVADLDGNSIQDLVVNKEWSLAVYLASEHGTLALHQRVSNLRASGLLLADLDGSGLPDIVASGYSAGILLNNGDGTFQTRTSHDFDGNCAVVGDFDGDRIYDLITAETFSGELFIGDGSGGFVLARRIDTGTRSVAMAAVDLDRDAHLDLVAANRDAGVVTILLGNGDGTFQDPYVSAAGGTVLNDLAVTDLDGDGLVDVLVVANDPLQLIVKLGNGDGTLGSPVTYQGLAETTEPASLITGDTDGDGTIDVIIVPGGSTADMEIWSGNGDGTFGPATTVPSYPTPQAAAAGYFNADDQLDLVVRSDTHIDVLLNACGPGDFPPTRRRPGGRRAQ